MITLSTETNTSPLDAWSTFTAINLHFNTERDYDAFKYNFKGPRCKRETFMTHKNRFQFEKLAKDYPNRNDIILYSVANMINGNKWIGECSNDVYEKWQGRLQSIEYDYIEQIKLLFDYTQEHKIKFDDLILSKDLSKIPIIYELYKKEEITLNTLTILNIISGFTSDLDKKLKDPLGISQEISFMVKKYSPFLFSIINISTYANLTMKPWKD